MIKNKKRENSCKKINKLLIVIIIGLLSAFIAITLLVFLSTSFNDFEESVYINILQIVSRPTTVTMHIFTYASEWFVLLAICILFLAVPKTRKKIGTPLSISLAISAVSNNIIKIIFRRDRPPRYRWLLTGFGSTFNYSYPSGHAQNAVALYFALAIVLIFNFKHIKPLIAPIVLCFALPLLIAFSRLYLSVHFFGDVLSGVLIGAACALSAIVLNQAFKHNKGLKKHKSLRIFIDFDNTI
ncbi:MAG: phosphatase PAP2 family protein [Firmicutes bacterium]|nr:phosphatase PAP2 family protein [Bacillota bacterium]